MAEEHKRAKGSLSEGHGGEEEKRHSHNHPHHGFHAEKHPDGSYRVHKHHADGTVTEHGVGGKSEKENLDEVHDLMHEHFMPKEGEGGPAGAEQAEAMPPGEGGGAPPEGGGEGEPA